ncbi:hypothetical protein Tco_1409660 [Tanacetum coccineum]
MEVSYDLKGDCRNCVPRSLPWWESLGREDSITTQTCELSQEKFNVLLALYPVPSEYHVILPKSNQTIFDAPLGYVGLYTHSFSLSNLRLPLTEFFCELMDVSPLSTSSEGSLICVELYPQLLSKQNKLDLKSFKDKLPPNIEENPIFQHLSRYPTSVRVFLDPIHFLDGLKPSWEHGQQRPAIMANGKEMAFRNFIYSKDVEDLTFLPKEPSLGFGTGSPSISVNTEPLKANKEPDIQPVERGSSRPPVKRKLASGSSTSRATHAKTSSSKDDAPFLIVSNDDEGLLDVLKLKDANVFRLKISAITPLAWKNHLDNHIDLELLDLHDHCYAIQAVVDNAVNRRSCKLLQVIKKLRGECDVIRRKERARDEECEGLQVKCNGAMTDFKKNPAIKGTHKIGLP